MRRLLILCAALCLLTASAAAAGGLVPVTGLPESEQPDNGAGRIIRIPLDADTVPGPYEKYYTSETSYEDPSISVWMEQDRAWETDYLVVHIRIANGSQIRTILESPDGRDTQFGDRLARHAGAVVAINGDYFRNHRQTEGHYIVRQGHKIMTNINSDTGENFDVLVIDGQGDFTVVRHATRNKMEAYEDRMVNVFSFGPALIVDGQPTDELYDYTIGSDDPAQRVAICQTGPLEYLIVVTAGPENPGSVGLSLPQFQELLTGIDGIEVAYNLDGGASATLIFDGKKANEFNHIGHKRAISDMIVFVSAWEEN